MAAASRSLATALSTARFANGLLRLSYTTSRDTTPLPGEALRIVATGEKEDGPAEASLP